MAQLVTGQQSLICGGHQDELTTAVLHTYLPYERSCCVLSAFPLPIAPPQPVGGGERLGLHDLRVVYVAMSATVSTTPGLVSPSPHLSMSNACLKFSIR